MENPIRYSTRGSLHQLSVRQTRSGYEPSDTETELYQKPRGERDRKSEDDSGSGEPNVGLKQIENPRLLRLNRRRSAKFDHEGSSPVRASLATNPAQRRHSKSPYKTRRDDGNARSPNGGGSELRRNISPLPQRLRSDNRKHVSPFSKSEQRRHLSPFKPVGEVSNLENDEVVNSNRKQTHRLAGNEISQATDKSNYSHRSKSAPRVGSRDKDQHAKYDHRDQKRGVRSRTPSSLPKNVTPRKDREGTHENAPSVGEINEMVANAKISKTPVGKIPNLDSTDSIAAGDIFFSRDYAALTMQKIIFPKKGDSEKISGSYPHAKGNIISNYNTQASTVLTRRSVNSSSGVSRQSSNASDASGRSTGSSRKFTANRQKSQTEAWFSCIKKGSCRTSKKSPEKERAFDEASFIEKAFVVENLRQFWADKHQPSSLNGFTCHKQEAQLLKQLASNDNLPHILLKGPPGSGKKTLSMALLREIYGDAAQNISHDLRYFQIQETRLTQVVVPLTSSPHHVELNVYLEPNVRYALMALVKKISINHAVSPEISTINFKADYTGSFMVTRVISSKRHDLFSTYFTSFILLIAVMVLYDVDKADESIQHLIKWIMECYTDICKLILCCEDDVDILEPVKECCKVIKVDAPITHEIMEVLIQIARKENFDLSMNFAAKIANKSKQNLRKAIMALEACKWHNYPFAEDQPIPMAWEEVIIELAAETLADPSHKRLFYIRGKFQKLLVEFVHPKLILLKLVELFLKGVEGNLKRELYYWHAYYDKRLPVGTSALLKLEEFVAKFMGMHRKSCSSRQ